MTRGDRGEISVTVRDAAGQIIAAPASVKLYKNGIPSDQSSTSHGRAFFIPRSLGDFTIVVEAAGYKIAQKDVSMMVAGKAEIDIYLQRDLASNEGESVPGKPILAPAAQEALSKGTQALKDGKLDEAEKQLNRAAKLAPANPNVLYLQGMLYMKQSKWENAQSVLERSNQIEPNQPRVLSALGMALCNQKKYETAIPILEKSVQMDPNSGWETDLALAKSYYFHEQYGQALKMAEQAHTTSHGSSPQVELILAQCLTAVGRYEDSANVLREFLKSNGQSPEGVTARRWLDSLAADGKIRR
jgi:tetratricopeptide (TPR) repeat protein